MAVWELRARGGSAVLAAKAPDLEPSMALPPR